VDFFLLFCGILKIGDTMQQYYDLLIRYSDVLERKEALTDEDKKLLAKVDKIALENSDVKQVITFFNKTSKKEVRDAFLHMNMKKKRIPIHEVSFDFEQSEKEIVLVVHEKNVEKRKEILLLLDQTRNYIMHPKMLDTLSEDDRQYFDNLIFVYQAKLDKLKNDKKSSSSKRIAGYIDALMLGWFTGFFASLTLAVMFYIFSK
jgi:hypothetical protein